MKGNTEMSRKNLLSRLFELRTYRWDKIAPRFFVGFSLYAIFSFLFVVGTNNDVSLLQAASLSLFTGVIFTGIFILALSGLRPTYALEEKYGNIRGWIMRRSKNDPPENQEEPSGDGDENALRKSKRIERLDRDARSMHDKVLSMGAILGVGMALYWLIMFLVFGSTPKEVFLIPWLALAALWFFQIALLPKWMTYFSFFSVVGLRVAFEVFGPTILMILPNFIMLPFFYLFMMIFMFGSIMIPNIMQFKFYRPGDATWETPKGSVRGQPEANAEIETQMRRFYAWSEGKSVQKPTRGMIFEGPPGTGKTLKAKELGTEAGLPYVFADASAFNAPMMGFAALLVKYLRARTESLCREYGGAFVFIDEAELILVRSGMGQKGPGVTGNIHSVEDVLTFDNFGAISECGLTFDTAAARDKFWDKKFAKEEEYKHGFFVGGIGGGMGAEAANLPMLTWLSGADSPPMLEKIRRRIVNNLLDALFMPTKIGSKVLRLPPGKAPYLNLMFIAATNRAWMIDPAMSRPGRYGVTVKFVHPDLDARADIAKHYLDQWHARGFIHPDLVTKERIYEFAGITQGMSPAEIEQVIVESPDKRVQHITTLKRIKGALDSGIRLESLTEAEKKAVLDFGTKPPEALLERDRKYWLRYQDDVGKPGWDDERADWHALTEAQSSIRYGQPDPGKTSDEHRKTTARHEFRGHFIELSAFLGKWMKPTVLTIMPRRNALGMVAHVPLNDRDPRPQEFYEGILRIVVGSTAAERFYFGSNQPGVNSDLEAATNIACFMVGRCAMSPYDCSKGNLKRYIDIGETLISIPGASLLMGDPQQTFISGVLQNKSTRERVAGLLGQAFVDDYRLIRANAKLFNDIDGKEGELMRIDEFSGNKLAQLWERLGRELMTLEKIKKATPADENLTIWPDRIIELENPFYGVRDPEAEEMLR